MFLAVETNSLDMVELLIRSGSDVNVRDKVSAALISISDVSLPFKENYLELSIS